VVIGAMEWEDLCDSLLEERQIFMIVLRHKLFDSILFRE